MFVRDMDLISTISKESNIPVPADSKSTMISVFLEIVYPSITKVRLGSLIYGLSDIGWVS